MYLAGMPYHIIQRGNNREACFFNLTDYQFYLDLLVRISARYEVYVHAYVLMTNHIHLLATPSETDGISRMTRVVGSRYAQYVNKRYRRTGTMWEGRHKSSLIDSENYLLKCYRYIEMNPVRANMVERPEEYRWSSYHSNAWGDVSEIVTPHSEYLALGRSVETRCRSYRELFKCQLDNTDIHLIRKASHFCQPTGNEGFRARIENKLGRKTGTMKRGRPKKANG